MTFLATLVLYVGTDLMLWGLELLPEWGSPHFWWYKIGQLMVMLVMVIAYLSIGEKREVKR